MKYDLSEMIVQDQLRLDVERAGRQNGHTQKENDQQEIEDLNLQSQRIESLMEEVDALPDADIRELVQECLQEMLGFYGKGLERILKIVKQNGPEVHDKLVADDFVSGLLLIHDLHPTDLLTRLQQAIDKVRPYMDSHGGSVEIVSVEDNVARLKLQGSCNGCPSSASTMELAIKQAIDESCPDLLGLEVEGVVDAPQPKKNAPGWTAVEGIAQMRDNTMKTIEIDQVSLVLCKANNQLYAYRNLCPACELPLDSGTLEGNYISCRLGHRYDIKLAGKCPDAPEFHLQPCPLLEMNGAVQVAVG
jgi:Fe-S cluster biogenesis protein NfuA/nitrite reductase/ring-hydroxylating ferredoxin subunit/uncharacterized protein (UPF0335 family)